METRRKEEIGKTLMEWECHGFVWQLLISRSRWPARWIWAPQCPICGSFGQSCNELSLLRLREKGGSRYVRNTERNSEER